MDKAQEIQRLLDTLENMTDSPLYTYRTQNGYNPVLGEGNADASIVFVGEAPGENEAKTGRPFVGAAGKMLDELLTTHGMKREDVYITNIVNDRPPGNRDPEPQEIEFYTPVLKELLSIIQPKVIATLGRFSMQFILNLGHVAAATDPIGRNHGKTFSFKTSYGDVTVVPLYHPAAALYNGGLKDTLVKDMSVVAGLVSEKK